MAFSHKVNAQQDVLKEAQSDFLDRAGNLYVNGSLWGTSDVQMSIICEKFQNNASSSLTFPPPLNRRGGEFPDAKIISAGQRLPRRLDFLHPGVPRDTAWSNQFLKLSIV